VHGGRVNDLKDVSVEIPKPPASTSPTPSSCSALLDRVVDSGKSVIVIEHHHGRGARRLDHRPRPGAGHDAGRIVFESTPADLVANRSTLTGEHLAAYVET
jgi:excinuclease UvrABC ATPase subunit